MGSENNGYYSRWRKLSSFASWHVRKKVFDLFMKTVRPTASDSVLDLGITADLLHEADNFFEKLYPFPSQITGAGIEDLSGLKTIYPQMELVQADGRNLPFKDKSFDIVFAGAVLEHVGSKDDQKKFVSEALRVGKKVFITTPNRNFPVEVHTGLPFLHLLPYKLYRKTLNSIGMEFFAKEENLNLLRKKDFVGLFEKEQIKFSSVKLLSLPLILIAIKAH